MNFGHLDFPIATMKRIAGIKDDGTCIYYNGQALLKRKDLFTTFNLNEPFLPKTYSYCYSPGSLLASPNVLKGKVIIDNSLNLHVPVKKVKLKYSTGTFISKHNDNIKVAEVSFLLQDVGEKTAKYPLLCTVEGMVFLVGWKKEKMNTYETYI